MKLINKLQGGGAMPFVSYTPNPVSSPQQAPTPGEESSNKKDTGMTKDIMKMIVDNGIPSDVDAFVQQISSFKGGLFDSSSGIDSLMQTPQGYAMIVSQLNKLNYNKQELLKARDQLYSNGGLQEAAIGVNGTVFGKDENGNLKTMSIEEYSKNSDKYRLLSNNDLLQMRSYDKNGAFNDNITSVLQNGQGMKNVTEEVQQVINKLQTTKQTRDDFMTPDQVEALRGINQLTGVAKITSSDERASRSQKDAAKIYLFNTLSQSAKNLLKLKAAERGVDPNKGALDLIETLITSSSKIDVSQSIDLKDVGGSGMGKESSEKQGKIDFKTAIANDMYQRVSTEIKLGSNMAIKADAYSFGDIKGEDGKTLAAGTGVEEMLRSAFGGVADTNNVYLGNSKINVAEGNKIAYTGEGGAVVSLPAIKEGNKIIPDTQAIERMKEAEEQIKKNNVTNINAIKAVYERFNVWQYHPRNPNKSDNTAQFIQIPVYAFDSAFNFDTSHPFYRELSGSEAATAERLIKKAYTGKEDGSLDFNSWYWKDDVYKTNIYVAKSTDPMGAGIGNELYTAPKQDYETLMKKHERLQTQAKMAQNHAASGAITSKDVYNQK